MPKIACKCKTESKCCVKLRGQKFKNRKKHCVGITNSFSQLFQHFVAKLALKNKKISFEDTQTFSKISPPLSQYPWHLNAPWPFQITNYYFRLIQLLTSTKYLNLSLKYSKHNIYKELGIWWAKKTSLETWLTQFYKF